MPHRDPEAERARQRAKWQRYREKKLAADPLAFRESEARKVRAHRHKMKEYLNGEYGKFGQTVSGLFNGVNLNEDIPINLDDA